MRIKTLSPLLAVVVAVGCTTYSSSFIIGRKTRQFGSQIEPPQFFKVDISGRSCFQRTEFQSGWYDKDAVDKLFSEVVTETSARNADTGGAVAPTAATTTLPVETTNDDSYLVFGPEGQTINPANRRLVMIAANNPKAIVDQIDAFASNADMSTAITTLMQRSDRQARLDADRAASRDERARGALEAEIARVESQLPATADEKWNRDRVQRLIDDLLRSIPIGR